MPSPHVFARDGLIAPLRRTFAAWRHVGPTLVSLLRNAKRRRLRGLSLGDLTGPEPSVLEQWLLGATMLSYSMPYPILREFPAEIAVTHFLRALTSWPWTAVIGGTYRYVERIVERFRGRILLQTEVRDIRRDGRGVHVTTQRGDHYDYDRVVFATTPDRVLPILADASDDEKRRFGAWRSVKARTVAHTDVSFYERYRTRAYSPCDIFAGETPSAWGYNCHLNLGLRWKEPTPYSFAYNMDSKIRPETIVHTHEHTVPYYTVPAIACRDEVRATNGERGTYHVGAYFGNGLHEGAVASAMDVARMLGGRVI